MTDRPSTNDQPPSLLFSSLSLFLFLSFPSFLPGPKEDRAQLDDRMKPINQPLPRTLHHEHHHDDFFFPVSIKKQRKVGMRSEECLGYRGKGVWA